LRAGDFFDVGVSADVIDVGVTREEDFDVFWFKSRACGWRLRSLGLKRHAGVDQDVAFGGGDEKDA